MLNLTLFPSNKIKQQQQQQQSTNQQKATEGEGEQTNAETTTRVCHTRLPPLLGKYLRPKTKANKHT